MIAGTLIFIKENRKSAPPEIEQQVLASEEEVIEDIELPPEEEAAESQEKILIEAEEVIEPIEPKYIYPIGQVVNEKEIDFDNLIEYFQSNEISEEIYARINGKSYVENNDIALSQLRYLTVLHYNFNHEIQSGELIVNTELADDFTNIFLELFQNEYEINSMRLIDDFWVGDGISSDTESIKNNNTSAFCYRQIFGGSSLSNHARGYAIDINPIQNPYVKYSNGKPSWYPDYSSDYIVRNEEAPHVITNNDICYKIFSKYGFTWGGDWNSPKDYQHFEKKI